MDTAKPALTNGSGKKADNIMIRKANKLIIT